MQIKILLVEDQKLMRIGIKSLFSDYPDLEIIGEAVNGKEAIEKSRLIKPDIVLMDIGLPDISGIEAAKQILEHNNNIKVIMLTSHISEEELNHMLYLGTLIALSKQNDGTYTIYMPGTEAGEDYDYYISDSVAKTAEMTYSSVQDDYGNGKNYIPSLKPGESVQVNMAWIVNEKDIKNLYLNLNGTGGCYEITENMCHTGVVYVGNE